MEENMGNAISELIGALANTAVANDGTKIDLKALAKILTKLDIDSHLWKPYQSRTDDLIRKAHGHFANKGDASTADNIKKTFVKSKGQLVIP
jgi:hypothetical protein